MSSSLLLCTIDGHSLYGVLRNVNATICLVFRAHSLVPLCSALHLFICLYRAIRVELELVVRLAL